MSSKKFYIGKRDNPQLSKPYYKAYGQLTKKDAKAKTVCSYGSMTLSEYDSQEEFDKTIESLKEAGFKVN